MRHRRALTLACLLLATDASYARAQASAPPASPTQTLNANSTLVLVPALVRNKAGELVFTLKADDFVLTDDGIPQKLTLERDTGSEPLALVVLIQAGAASKKSAWYPKMRGTRHGHPFLTMPIMIEAMVGNVPHRIAVVRLRQRPRTAPQLHHQHGCSR